MTLEALVVVRNEEDVLEGCLKLLSPYVNGIILVDMQSTDRTREIASQFEKVKIFDYPYSEPLDMGKARTFSLQQSTADWIIQVDGDEWFEKESLEKIRAFIENPGGAISLRIGYWNISWRAGWVQSDFGHYPDRLYRRDVIQGWEGVLPLDMTVVKPEFRTVQHKGKGIEGVLEYDNADDRSFESKDYPHKNPKQPVRKDIFFYHLARSRGFNFEYTKRLKYEHFIHPAHQEWEHEQNTRSNQWLTGLYPMEKHNFPEPIPSKSIPNPKVDIIVSCYNKGAFIGETIESLLNQTYKADRILVVDDGSTDNSAEIIKKYPVEYIHQQNQGVAVARNTGINKRTGDYFVLIDGDDRLHETYVERCLQEMKGDIQVVWTDFQGLGEWDWRHHYSGNIDELKNAQCVPSVMALYDSHCVDPYGAFDPSEWYEDYGWFIRLRYQFQGGLNFKHIPEPLCYYRRTKGTRIDMLDEKRAFGFQQLRERYGKFGVDPK